MPRPFVIELGRLYYPSWAKDDWREGQGFPGSDAEARTLALRRFTGLAFDPSATLDAAGELERDTESGHLQIDDIYFR